MKQAGAELGQDQIKLAELFTLTFFHIRLTHCFNPGLNHNTPMGGGGGGKFFLLHYFTIQRLYSPLHIFFGFFINIFNIFQKTFRIQGGEYGKKKH